MTHESTNHNQVVYKYDKPLECPYCGAYCDPTRKAQTSVSFNNVCIYLLTFFVRCCDKDFFCIYESNDKILNLLLVYPPIMTISLPDNIKELSPRFTNLFNQAAFAEQNNFFELAGTGYRNAIEILIKDFAINKLHADSKEVCSCSLDRAISNYLPNVNSKVSADILRQLGNSYTHYENKHNDIDFSILKQYIDIFIKTIECELLLLDPILSTKHIPKD